MAKKKLGQKLKGAIKKVGEGLKKVGQKTINVVKKVNPISATARTGVLAALRLNLFGHATRLFPGMATEAEIQQYHLKRSNIPAAQSAYLKAKNHFVSIMQGSESLFRQAIAQGFKKPVFNKNKDRFEAFCFEECTTGGDLVDIYEERNVVGTMTTAALITAATPVIIKLADMIKESKADKNPFEAGMEPEGFVADYQETPPANEEIDLSANEKSSTKKKKDMENEKLLGMPKTVAYVVFAIIFIILIIIAIRMFRAKKG